MLGLEASKTSIFAGPTIVTLLPRIHYFTLFLATIIGFDMSAYRWPWIVLFVPWESDIVQPHSGVARHTLATDRFRIVIQSGQRHALIAFYPSTMFNNRPNSGGTMHTFLNPMLLNNLSKPASVNIFENITAGEDVFQLIGSANGHPTSAKSISAKAQTTQCFGDLSDSTFQQILKKRYASIDRNKDL